MSCDVSCDDEQSGEAAVLEIQPTEEDEYTSKEPGEKKLLRESKSASALMRPTEKQSEEEGGIRIIKYNNIEPSLDGECIIMCM